MQRVYYFDNLKAALIFLVVIGHVFELVTSSLIDIAYIFIYIFHMPLFIFVSGYFAKYNPKKLLFGLIPLYFLFQLLYIVFARYALGHTWLIIQFTTPHWIMWYLFALIVWICFVPMLEAFEKKKAFLAILFAFVIGILAGFEVTLGYYMSLARIFYFLPFFVMGFYAQRLKDFPRKISRWYIRVIFGALTAGVAYLVLKYHSIIDVRWLWAAFSYESLAATGYSYVVRLAKYGCAVIVSVFLMSMIPKGRWFFSYIGKNTLPVFLIHGFVLMLMRDMEVMYFIPGGFVTLGFVVAVSVVIVLVLSSGLFSPNMWDGFFKSKTAIIIAIVVFMFAPIEVQASQPIIRSRAAIVLDFDTGEILFEYNAREPRAPASMTKAMTAFIVFEEIAAGRLNFDDIVTISSNAARISSSPQYQGVTIPISAGTQHTVDALLHFALLPSSNAAPVALAEHIAGTEEAFVERMNQTAAEIGMWAEFQNAHGSIDQGHLSDAYSFARLAYVFINRHPDILRITGTRSFVFQGTTYNNTNLLLRTRPFAGADGFKTGTTRAAGRNITGTAIRNDRRIIAVQLGAPSQDARYTDIINLLEFGFAEAARRDEWRAMEEEDRLEVLRMEAEWEESMQREILASRITVFIDGEELGYNNGQFHRIMYELAMVQAAPFFEALGVRHYTEENGNIFVSTNDGREILFLAGQDLIFADGNFYESFMPQYVEDEIFIPVRYAAGILGLTDLIWHGDTNTLLISTVASGSTEIAVAADVFVQDAPVETNNPVTFNEMFFVTWMTVIFVGGALSCYVAAYAKHLSLRIVGYKPKSLNYFGKRKIESALVIEVLAKEAAMRSFEAKRRRKRWKAA